jgi:hypothetical protein
MKLRPEEILELLGIVDSFQGKSITISESISRSRDRGHDRATTSTIPITVDSIRATPDGTQLALEGDQTRYVIALEIVARFRLARNGDLEIAEHFEEQTERLTTLRV